MKGQPFYRRLRFARHGLTQAWRRERSLRTHLLAATLVLLVLLLTRPAAIWWAVLTLTVGLVVIAELLNSAWKPCSTTCTRSSTRRSAWPRTSPPRRC